LKRSDIGSHAWISDVLDRPVVSLELVDSRWYHLDTCLFVLNPGLIAFYPGAFDDYGVRVLRDNYDTIEVNEQEALRFCCNAVKVGNDVVLPSDCPVLAQELNQRGYATHFVEMSEFIKAGGAAKCLTLFLR
jgi:N-dimethylarginine dimethylaminohydrolase